jgi:hypothetical protein
LRKVLSSAEVWAVLGVGLAAVAWRTFGIYCNFRTPPGGSVFPAGLPLALVGDLAAIVLCAMALTKRRSVPVVLPAVVVGLLVGSDVLIVLWH